MNLSVLVKGQWDHYAKAVDGEALAENEVREEEPVNSTRRHRPELGRSLNSMIATRKIKCEAQSQTTSKSGQGSKIGSSLCWVTCYTGG